LIDERIAPQEALMLDVARNYAEWCELSGLYLANLSHLDRYRTYERLLSSAGVTIAIVSDFLHDVPELDVSEWRSCSVYEFGPDQSERVERTASAFREIGAAQLADAIGSARSSSPWDALQGLLTGGVTSISELEKSINPLELLESLKKSFGKIAATGSDATAPVESSQSSTSLHETRARIDELLEQFAQRHWEALQADMERHGDPRTEPEYTKPRRLRELETLRDRWVSHRQQADTIETLTTVMNKLPRVSASTSGEPSRKAAAHLRQLVRQFREKSRELRRVANDDQSDSLRSFLPELQAFKARFADLVNPDLIGDVPLRQAAEAIGEFSTDSRQKTTTLEWDAPAGLTCDWIRFRLIVEVPSRSKSALGGALQAVHRLQTHFPSLQEAWRQQILDSFRETFQGQMDDSDLEDYDLNENGEPTDAGILRHVTSGTAMVSTADPEGGTFQLTACVAVDWDEEHGLELEADVDLDSTEEPTAGFSAGAVTVTDCGPPVTPAMLQHFESTLSRSLPEPYRDFLSQFNGGVPSRTYLVRTREGMPDNWHVVRFFHLAGTQTPPFPPDSLESRLHLRDGTPIFTHLLPIAQLRKSTFDPYHRETTLAILLTGNRAGKICVLDPELMLMPLLHTGDSANEALNEIVRDLDFVASSFAALWKKLRPAPDTELPPWLQHIRQNNVDAFVAWWEQGGKVRERLIEPAADFQPTVVDLLTAEASDELLETVLRRKIVKPKALRESWRQFLIGDVARFAVLMRHLPRAYWHDVLSSPCVWDHPDLLEQLVAANIDLETPVNDEGATALHLAVQMGRTDAVRWLLDHGADPRKEDRYGRSALIWAERGPGHACLAMLEGRPEPVPTGTAAADAPGIALLADAANALQPGLTLQLQIEIQSPPVTRIEKIYYVDTGCHYRLTFEINSGQVTFNDTRSPRQDYLNAGSWTDALFAPILEWPELTPLWDTLVVQEFDLKKAIKSRKYQPTPRPDLIPAARSALEQAFNAREAAARGIRIAH